MPKNTEKVVGYFGVDSGQAIVCDPAYLQYFENDNYNGEDYNAGMFSYSGACGVTVSGDMAGQLTEPFKGDNPPDGEFEAGVAFSTGYGDGVYPVTAHYNEDGRVSKITIDFE